MLSYDERWSRIIAATPDLKDKTKTVFIFLRLFKKHFDGNGPTLEEIVSMLTEVYGRNYNGRSSGSYHLGKLVAMGLVEIIGGRRTAGRIIIKEGEWCYRGIFGSEVYQEQEEYHESFTSPVPGQNSVEPDHHVVGKTSLL